MSIVRGVLYGIRNLWWFRRELWGWRGWDFEYSYNLFVRALEGQAQHERHYGHHVTSQSDAKDIDAAVAAYRRFVDGPDVGLGPGFAKEYIAEEQRLWEAFHSLLVQNARGWWD